MLIFAERGRRGASTYKPLGTPCFVDPGIGSTAQR
jgi:hypothetical protein